MVRRGSAVRVRQRALQKRRKRRFRFGSTCRIASVRWVWSPLYGALRFRARSKPRNEHIRPKKDGPRGPSSLANRRRAPQCRSRLGECGRRPRIAFHRSSSCRTHPATRTSAAVIATLAGSAGIARRDGYRAAQSATTAAWKPVQTAPTLKGNYQPATTKATPASVQAMFAVSTARTDGRRPNSGGRV